jgi:hypothetical protein
LISEDASSWSQSEVKTQQVVVNERRFWHRLINVAPLAA